MMFYARSLIAAAALLVALSSARAQAPANPPAPRNGSMQDMMRGGEMMDGGSMGMGGMMGGMNAQESAKDGGIVGMVLSLEADSIGAPGRLVVRAVEPQSPAHYAGIMRGDRIVAVDGQAVEGKKLNAVVDMVRGEVGSTVKLGLDRDGKAREVTLTRVEPQRRAARGMGRGGGMDGMGDMRGMMDMMRMHQNMMGSAPGGNATQPQR